MVIEPNLKIIQEAWLVLIKGGAMMPPDNTSRIAVDTVRSVYRTSLSGRIAIHPELGVGAVGM
jgi:hypothetical protein